MTSKFATFVLAIAMLALPIASAFATVDALSPAGIVTAQLAPINPGTRRPTVCTEQYAPVCGRLGSLVKTYSNQCYARAAGAEMIADGPCANAMVPPRPQ